MAESKNGKRIELPDALHDYLERTTVRAGYQRALEVNRPKFSSSGGA